MPTLTQPKVDRVSIEHIQTEYHRQSSEAISSTNAKRAHGATTAVRNGETLTCATTEATTAGQRAQHTNQTVGRTSREQLPENWNSHRQLSMTEMPIRAYAQPEMLGSSATTGPTLPATRAFPTTETPQSALNRQESQLPSRTRGERHHGQRKHVGRHKLI